MATWSSDNHGNDGACDFRDGVVARVLETATPPRDALEIDEIMASIEIVLAIWQRCGVSGRIYDFDTQTLRQKVLQVFDAESADYYPDPEFRKERRTVIERTFDELQLRQSQ